MTYEEWLESVVRLLKTPKSLNHFEEDEILPRLWRKRYSPTGAVCFIQDLRDGVDGINDA